jgi:hypothetical protein
MIAEPGDKVGLAVAGLWSGQEEEAAQSCRDPAGIAALQERLDRLQDLGEYRMMDPRDSRQLGRMVDKKIFQKGIGGVLFHKSLVRKISHRKNRWELLEFSDINFKFARFNIFEKNIFWEGVA